MAADVESLVNEYARRYSARDVEGVTELRLWPFLAIREGAASHLADRPAVRDHFTAMIDAYRDAGYASFAPVAIDTHQLGEHSAFSPSRPEDDRLRANARASVDAARCALDRKGAATASWLREA